MSLESMTTPSRPDNVPSTEEVAVNILLVDDEVRNLEVLESVLTSPNYRLVRAQSAEDALMALLNGEFAAIVLDIQMPGTSGIELAHLIKQRKKTSHIPIIFLTAYYQQDKDVLEGYEVGAVDYLTKPIDPQILKSKVAVFVELFEKTRELAALNSAMETEILQRRRAEEALRQANNELEARVQERTSASRRLAAIVESSEDAIVSKDLNGIITSWNHGAERLFGYKAEEMIGQSITILLPPERQTEEQQILDRIRRDERLTHYETLRRRKDGKIVEVSLTVSPIKDESGKIIGASKIGRNITKQKQAERQLERAHKEVLAASRAKDDFLAALSHELRTPLNPVLLLASDAADDEQVPADLRARFATIRNSVELEARLIDDLLDITRITHGKLLLNMATVDVHAVLSEALTTVRSELDQKQIALTLDLGASHPMVKGDSVRLQQVFWNVLKNAVKFTPKTGKVSVATRTQTDGGELIVSITDSGIGLTTDELAGIFKAFAQGEHARDGGSHRFGGLGLGLAISQMLVESHWGSISAASEGRGKGSTFVIKLPLLLGAINTEKLSTGIHSKSPGQENQKPETIQVLLVEDHESTRTTLAHLLTRRRYQVKTAATVAEARKLAAQQKFHLVISDIGLPDGNGFDLMSELRAQDADLQGIALTGYGMEEDIARSQNAGFARHLTKPIRVQALDAALAATMPG